MNNALDLWIKKAKRQNGNGPTRLRELPCQYFTFSSSTRSNSPWVKELYTAAYGTALVVYPPRLSEADPVEGPALLGLLLGRLCCGGR